MRARIATASPSAVSSQVSSQGRVHTRPQTAGKGLFSRIIAIASSNFLFAIRLTYAFTLTPAGQAVVQGGFPLSSTRYFFPSTAMTPLVFSGSVSSIQKLMESSGLDDVFFGMYVPPFLQ